MANGQKSAELSAKIAELNRQLWLQNAQDVANYSAAQADLHAIAKRDFTASGLIIQVQDLTGKTLLRPVMIANGLGGSTLEQISRDIYESHQRRLAVTSVKPAWQWKGV
jgi:hypothetical protein